MVRLRYMIVVVVGLCPCCETAGCGCDAARRCQGRRGCREGAADGLRQRCGRFDGIIWHREQGRKASEGTSNVTEQRTCRV